MSAVLNCDDCGAELLPVLGECYCPSCDIGEGIEVLSHTEHNRCSCGMKLAVWYPHEKCPKCLELPQISA
jgi:hypothetical protein